MKAYQILIYRFIEDEMKNRIIASEGIEKNDLEEIEELFQDSLENSWSFFNLSTQKKCFVRTYVNDDKKVHITHGLIFDGEFDFYPCDLVSSFSFVEDLGIEELSIIEDVKIKKGFSESSTLEFLKPMDPKVIRDMTNAIIDFKESRRSIYIVDREDRFIELLRALSLAFPRKLTGDITFTTLQRSKEIECLIYFSKRSLELKDKYIFDFIREMKAVVDREYKYSEIVEIGYFASLQTLKNYHKLLQDFSYNSIDWEIDSSYILFILLNIGPSSLHEEYIKMGLKFLLDYGSEEVLQGIFESYRDKFKDAAAKLHYDGASVLSEALFRGIENTSNNSIYEYGLDIFFEILEKISNEDKGSGNNYALFNKYFERNVSRGAFLKYLLSGEKIKHILEVFSGEEQEKKLGFYIYAVIKSAVELGYSWSQIIKIENMEVFLDLSSRQLLESRSELRETLGAASKSMDIYVHVLLLLYNRATNHGQIELLLERLVKSLKEVDEDKAIDIRRNIYRLSGGKILTEEFELKLMDSPDKKGFFKDYLNKVFYKIPDYYNKHFSEVVKKYLLSLDPESAYSEAVSFLQTVNENMALFDEDSLRAIVISFERGVKIEDLEGIKENVKFIKKIKRSRGMETNPDITALIDFLYYLDENKGEIEIKDVIKELRMNLGYIGGQRYKRYIEECTPRLIKNVKSKDDHRAIVSFLNNDDNEGELLKRYIFLIEKNIEESSGAGYDILRHFIVYYFFYLEANYRLLGELDIIKTIEDEIIRLVSKKDREFLSRLDFDIKRDFNENGYSIPLKWNQIYAALSVESKSFRSKLKNMFKK